MNLLKIAHFFKGTYDLAMKNDTRRISQYDATSDVENGPEPGNFHSTEVYDDLWSLE